MPVISALVEGDVDAAVAVRIIEETGHEPGLVYGRRGFGYIRDKIGAYNRSARQIAYLALVDLMDTRLACAPAVRAQWLPHANPGMIFRIVVREIESWLLADREGIASFLSVPLARVPLHPETLPDPKQAMVNTARRSRRPAIRRSMVPEDGSRAQTGRLYANELCAFAQGNWNVTRAAANASSLARCLGRLRALGTL
jgi:hypothetical protein